jgi:hypothetical protein|tara:strand:- start:1365 stop:1583 length:219 start_codon:yes stop_codon:yes gene_type:complete
MNIDFSDRKIMAAGLALLVVAAGLGIYLIADSFDSDLPLPDQRGTGSFSIEVVEVDLTDGEEITETSANEAH